MATPADPLVKQLAKVLQKRSDLRVNAPTVLAIPPLTRLASTQQRPHLLSTRWRQFHRSLTESWEAHNVLEQMAPVLHAAVVAGGGQPRVAALGGTGPGKTLSRVDTLGVIQKLRTTLEPERTLVDAVAHFEVCLDDLAKALAGDWLEAAVAAANRGVPGVVSKPLAQALARRTDANIIVAAALERYARRVAPPTVFFQTDAVVSGFADHFSRKHGTLIQDLMEINARRNLALHARTRVDATYLATVPGTTHKIGDKLQIDTTYLTDALRCLRAIATCAYGTVAQLYGGVIRGYFRSAYGSVH